MSETRSFQNLIIWQKADLVFQMICEDVKKWPNNRIAWSIASQLLSSGGSISANIAEGYGRGSPREFERFLLISRGSMVETDNWLIKAKTQGLISQRRYKEYQALFDELSRMMGSLINKLRSQPKRKLNGLIAK